ncbi:MAG TPA: peroxidase [Dehalococcoidia bacterium]|nr:peroxidase [Dehalococcoidia bacterium]
MEPLERMYLREVEEHQGLGRYAEMIKQMKGQGMPVPQLWHLFAYKPDRTDHLARFTQAVMRGPSPLSAGFRELIAAFTSRRNQCLF